MTDSSQPMTLDCRQNTDREFWRGPDEGNGAFYADSIHVTVNGGIGINCGGHVIVMPLRDWHALAVEGEQVPVGWKDALKNLETACENLALTRSQATYLSMLDVDGAQSQLEALDMARREARAMLSSAPASPVREREKIIEECAIAAGLAAWKHVGDDAYSQGMDRGAIHQVEKCVEAIRALKDSHHD